MTKFNFIPFKRIGEFQLGMLMKQHTRISEFNFEKDKDATSWDIYYNYDLGISIYTESITSKIVSIAAYKECYYNGENIMGLSLEKFVSLTKEKYYGEPDCLDFEEDNIPQYVYEFEDIGLQVWVKNNKIVTVIASNN